MLPILMLLIGQSGFVTSPIQTIEAALDIANVQPSDIVLDIGCGDGRVCVIAAKKYGCKAVGIEYDENLARLAKTAIKRNRVVDLVEIKHENALEIDISEATVLYIYHQVEFLQKLRPQLTHLNPGTKVLFLNHAPPWLGLDPKRRIKVNEHEHIIYLWIVEDSVIVRAAEKYPGVLFHHGLRDPFLVEMAQECADLMAKKGGYEQDGHPMWENRYWEIRNTIGRTPVEVTAMADSDYYATEKEVGEEFFRCWKMSSGHWGVVSQHHAMFGDALAKSKQGAWFGCVIVAD